VPLAETVYDASGKVLTSFRFGDYVDAGDGALVPTRIEAETEGVSDHPMRYLTEFQVVDGVWLFKQGTIYEVRPDETVERAQGGVRKVKVAVKKATPAA
jgi:hypothetical protein